MDHQVKIRGFRIELGEIETVLRLHPAVREAVVMAREVAPGEKRLAAYIVGTAMEADLRLFLKSKLPDYMTPSAFVFLDALPLNVNGKVDRKALPAPDYSSSKAHEFVAPRTPLEKTLAKSWEEILGIREVGALDNFFVLGGHSLLAIQLVSRLRDQLAIELPLRSVFENQTLGGRWQNHRGDPGREREGGRIAAPLSCAFHARLIRHFPLLSSGFGSWINWAQAVRPIISHRLSACAAS